MIEATTGIKWALAELDGGCDRMLNYKAYCAYYDGLHPLSFATEKFRNQFWKVFRSFSLNLCASVVDVQAERLEITGFVSDKSTFDSDTLTTEDPTGAKAWDAWEAGRLDLVADRVHMDALKVGDGFLIAQPTGDGAIVWPQHPHQMAVRYSNTVPAFIELAAKLYSVSNFDKTMTWTLYLYEPGVVRRFDARVSEGAELAPEKFGDGTVVAKFDNDYMPVYHFPNKTMAEYGVSELRDVLPLQDAANKVVVDMLVAGEYQAFRQRWATGAELDELPEQPDPTILEPYQVATDGSGRIVARRTPDEHGPGALLMFPNPETKVGEFGQADISPFVLVKNSFQADIARVSGVPLSYFFVSTSETPSGEALAKAEVRFTRKGNRQKRAFGNHWEHVIAAVAGIPASVDLNAVWADDTSRNETEKLNALVLKQTLGVPNEALQKEMGYDDDEIKAFTEHKAAQDQKAADEARAAVEAKAAMTPPPQAPTPKQRQQPPSPQKGAGTNA